MEDIRPPDAVGVDGWKYSIMMQSNPMRLIRRALVLIAVVMIISACQSGVAGTTTTQDCPNPTSCGEGYEVTATSVDPNNTYAYNLIVDASLTHDDLRGIANDFHAYVGEGRFILFFFTAEAGSEVFRFGLMPTGDQDEAPEPLSADHLVGIVDVRRSGQAIERWYESASWAGSTQSGRQFSTTRARRADPAHHRVRCDIHPMSYRVKV